MTPHRDEPSPGKSTGPIVRLPSRAEVRALVMDQHRETMAAARRGRNVHQLGLDHKDKILAYAACLSDAHGDEAAAAFLALCAEEQDAVSAHLENEIAMQAARNAAREREARAQQEREAAFGAQFSPVVFTVVVLLVLGSFGTCFGS